MIDDKFPNLAKLTFFYRMMILCFVANVLVNILVIVTAILDLGAPYVLVLIAISLVLALAIIVSVFAVSWLTGSYGALGVVALVAAVIQVFLPLLGVVLFLLAILLASIFATRKLRAAGVAVGFLGPRAG